MGKTAAVSTVENDKANAKFAIDGDLDTTQASVRDDNQWIIVDLGNI